MDGLRRKIASGARSAGGDATLARELQGWTTAFRRIVAAAVGIDLDLSAPSARPLRTAELVEALPDLALLIRLDGPATGLLALGPDLLAALLEIRTLGRPGPRPVPERRATRTDAALVADLVDAALAALDAARPDPGTGLQPGLRFGAQIADARQAALLFEEDDDRLRLLSLTATLPGGARCGAVRLILPARAAAADHGATASAEKAFAEDLAEQVGASPVVLDAVLARLTLPLAEVLALAPGDWLRLGTAALDRVDLQGLDGLRRHGARLGQNRGMRAVRLSEEAAAAGRGTAPRAGAAAPPAETALRPTGT
jgi:flagellar motor switch protein FliM